MREKEKEKNFVFGNIISFIFLCNTCLLSRTSCFLFCFACKWGRGEGGRKQKVKVRELTWLRWLFFKFLASLSKLVKYYCLYTHTSYFTKQWTCICVLHIFILIYLYDNHWSILNIEETLCVCVCDFLQIWWCITKNTMCVLSPFMWNSFVVCVCVWFSTTSMLHYKKSVCAKSIHAKFICWYVVCNLQVWAFGSSLASLRSPLSLTIGLVQSIP